MATPAPWDDLVAAVGEPTAAKIAGENAAELFGLAQPAQVG
jgi:hypothetical protein